MDEELYRYAAKRFGEIHIRRTVEKLKIDLEHLAHLLRQSDKPILEYWTMLNQDSDTETTKKSSGVFQAKMDELIVKHGGNAALSVGKSVEAILKDFSAWFTKEADKLAVEAKKKEDAAKNRRKYIYQAFAELGNHVPEGDLVTGVIALSGVSLKEHATQKELIKAELDTMGEEQKLAWIIEGGSGLVLLEDEKGEDTQDAAEWVKKTQNFRPLRGRAAVAGIKKRK